MIDDIVSRLRQEWEYGNNAKGCDYEMFAQAADEIELLRLALQMACYEIFAYRDPRQTTPQKLVDHFMDEAVRGE